MPAKHPLRTAGSQDSVAQDKKAQKPWQNKHFWYSLMPLLVTLAAIVLINWAWPDSVSEPPSTRPSATAVAIQPATSATPPTRPPILQATILPTPFPTNTPRPELTTSATIILLGPPPESSVAANGRLTFYWAYSEPLLPGQQFKFTLRQNETIVHTATMTLPNLGDTYQLMVNLADLPLSPGAAVWQLQLTWADEQEAVLTSEERDLVLLTE